MPSTDELYRTHSAPWDIGRPQASIRAVVEAGKVRGRVLDVGCGTAEHALLCAEAGHEAWGVDREEAAIARARAKAEARGLRAELRVHDALSLASLGTRFDTVVDSGLFHVLDDAARAPYARSIASALVEGGALFVLAISEREPPWHGPRPRRVSEAELREAFAGLTFVSIEAARFETAWGDAAHAWLACFERR